MNIKKLSGLVFLFLLVFALLPLVLAIPPASISITAGHSYVLQLDGVMDTYRWGGIKYTSSGGARSESVFPIAYVPINSPIIYNASLAIGTFNDDHHYFAVSNIPK